MDALSDLLRVVRLDGAFFYAVEATGRWCVETHAARELAPRIMPAADHLISYHLLTGGRCYAGLVGEEPTELVAGDVIVFPHGDAYVMGSAPHIRIGPDVHGSTPARYPDTVYLGGAGPASASFICGFLGCDRGPFNPLLGSLPHVLHLRGQSAPWQEDMTRAMIDETRRGRPGAECTLTRLAELMFIEVLRAYLDALPPGQSGWLAGLRDPVVGRALTLLHARPAQPWTLADLARETATSRTRLAARFTALVGEPPMQYLNRWRMQVASNLLAHTGEKLSSVGADVGYRSEAAFSRAFKRATGTAPGAWRTSRGSTRL